MICVVSRVLRRKRISLGQKSAASKSNIAKVSTICSLLRIEKGGRTVQYNSAVNVPSLSIMDAAKYLRLNCV